MDRLVLRPYLALTIRLVLGGVFVWAGSAKLVQIPSFVETVAAFDMLPPIARAGCRRNRWRLPPDRDRLAGTQW